MANPNPPKKRPPRPSAAGKKPRAPASQPSVHGLDTREERWRNVTVSEVNGVLSAVTSSHNPDHVRTFLEYIYYRHRLGESVHEQALVSYLTHVATRAVEHGEDLAVAFGIRSEKGRYDRPETFGRDMAVAADVILRTRQLKSLTEAKEEAAHALFPDDANAELGRVIVAKAYKEHAAVLKTLADEYLEAMRLHS